MKKTPRKPKPNFAAKLVRLLSTQFTSPFLDPKLVQAKLNKDGSAEIKISRRDVSITASGTVTGAGTEVN